MNYEMGVSKRGRVLKGNLGGWVAGVFLFVKMAF